MTMKGIAHFLSGIAAASFIPAAVAQSAQGAWLLAPANVDVIFHVEPEILWEHVLRRLGIDPVTLVATPGIH